MSNNKLKKVSFAVATAGVMAEMANAAENEAVNKLIAKIKDKSDRGIAPFLTTSAIERLNTTNPVALHIPKDTRESLDAARDAGIDFET